MSSGFRADPAVLQTMASTLRNAALALDAEGNSAPDAPDAGEVTAEIGAVLGHLTSSAGELVVGVAATGDAVARGGAEYGEADEAGLRSFEGLG